MFAATQALHTAKLHSSHFVHTTVRRVQTGHSSGAGGVVIAADDIAFQVCRGKLKSEFKFEPV
jgi:hypothetical protein